MNNKQGYTLLFAVIISSVVLSIAAFILSVSRKQFILSSLARDSTVAVYAADGGIQCAVEAFNGYRGNLLATSTDDGYPLDAMIYCANPNPSPSPVPDAESSFHSIPASDVLDMHFIPQIINNLPGNTTFDGTKFNVYQTNSPLQINFSNNTCARIVITDGYYFDNHYNPKHKTVIDSSGYNLADSGPCAGPNSTPNARAVERTIRLEYKG